MDQSSVSPLPCAWKSSVSSDGAPFLPRLTTSHSIRRKTHTHLRSTSAISSQKMSAVPSDCEYRWLDSLMDHVMRRMKFKKTIMGYTGRGYKSTGRSPYGYVRDFGGPSRDLMELEATRSRPQSLVKSHQNEYKELIMADTNLIEGELNKVTTRNQRSTYQRRKSGCSPCHACCVTELP